MAKKSCTTLNSLQKEIMHRAKKALKNEVADYVKDELKRQVSHDVYFSYTPKVYNRRGEDNGLVDDNNLRSSYRDDSRTLYVYEEAPIEGPRLYAGDFVYHKDSLAQIIQEGAYNPWNYRDYKWTKPRPFMDNAQEYINEHHTKIMNMIKKRIDSDND